MTNLLYLVGKILPYLLVIAAFTFIYILVPNTRVRFRSALYGAVVAGALWETSGILFTSFIGGSSSYTAIYSGFAILLVFMIWLYLSWIILLVGSCISYYHQHPQQLLWNKSEYHLSARMREQLALQSMVGIARAHDQQSDLDPSLENLADSQQVPVEILERMLDALQTAGLIQQSTHNPPHYLPGLSLRRIKLLDILRIARAAEDDEQAERYRCDLQVSELMQSIERQLEANMGSESLADLLQKFEDED